MAHTVKTKPDKISAELETHESLVRSGPVHDIVLHLFRGFSRRIYLIVGSEEEENVNYYFPAYVKVKVRSNWVDQSEIDLGRALQMGLLEIADGNDRAVSLKPVDRELGTLCANLREVEPNAYKAYQIRKINARLLGHLRQCLLPGKQYKLRFCGQRFTIWSKFGSIEYTDEISEKPSEWPGDARIQMNCNPKPLLFTVEAGVRIPRFTVSFSISSSTCYLDETHKFFVTLTVTSLEDHPVTVAILPDRSRSAYCYPDEWYAETWDEVFDILDEEAGEWGVLCALCYDVGQFDEESRKRVVENKGAMPPLQFNKGTTYTRNVHFSGNALSSHERKVSHDFGGLTPGKTYKMANRPMGYNTWDYGRAHELRESHSNWDDWSKHGSIKFEPVSAVALTIKAIFEREKPKPFFSLPLELRDQVYEYLRWSEHANEVRFTAKEGREPCVNGVAGALRSG